MLALLAALAFLGITAPVAVVADFMKNHRHSDKCECSTCKKNKKG